MPHRLRGDLTNIYPERAVAQVVSVGVSHHDAPVAVRERLAFGERDLDAVYGALDGTPFTAAHELVVVSTCNRTELYAVSRTVGDATDAAALTRLLTRGRLALPAEHLQTRRADEAVRHLCRVAAGLHSMIAGEAEVLGQVSRAHRQAASRGASGPVLDAVFSTALRAGRRARAETHIGRHAASVSSEAVRVLREMDAQLETRTVLVVGTGDMGRLAGSALRWAGVRDVIVVSRTTEHAQVLASELGARAAPWHELTDALAAADIVVSSTGAPHTVITAELVRAAVERSPRQRVIVDIAVPRDVDPDVGILEGIRLLDMDELQARVSANHRARHREAPAVERIIEEELARFDTWRRGRALRPVLAALHATGEQIRQRELARALRRLGGESPALRDELERFSNALVSGLLDVPSRRLRAESDPARAALMSDAARALFAAGRGEELP